MLPTRRPHLKALTTKVLNTLADIGVGGAQVDQIAARAGLRTRCAAARLRWLQRGGLVHYVPSTAYWHLADDQLFKDAR